MTTFTLGQVISSNRFKNAEINSARWNGFSLLELLVSIFLITLLLTLVIQHFLIAKKQYNKAEILLNQVFEEQLVESVIRNSVHSAGFTPCLPLDALISESMPAGKPLVAIEIKHDSENNAELHVNRMNINFSKVNAISGSMVLHIAQPLSLKIGQRVLIADCYHAEVREVQNLQRVNTQYMVRLNAPLRFNYDNHETYLGEWIEEMFFIQNNKRGKRALFYRREHTEELIPGIKKFALRWISTKSKPLLQVQLNAGSEKDILLEIGVRAG